MSLFLVVEISSIVWISSLFWIISQLELIHGIPIFPWQAEHQSEASFVLPLFGSFQSPTTGMIPFNMGLSSNFDTSIILPPTIILPHANPVTSHHDSYGYPLVIPAQSTLSFSAQEYHPVLGESMRVYPSQPHEPMSVDPSWSSNTMNGDRRALSRSNWRDSTSSSQYSSGSIRDVRLGRPSVRNQESQRYHRGAHVNVNQAGLRDRFVGTSSSVGWKVPVVKEAKASGDKSSIKPNTWKEAHTSTSTRLGVSDKNKAWIDKARTRVTQDSTDNVELATQTKNLKLDSHSNNQRSSGEASIGTSKKDEDRFQNGKHVIKELNEFTTRPLNLKKSHSISKFNEIESEQTPKINIYKTNPRYFEPFKPSPKQG